MQEILEYMGMIINPRKASYIKHKLSNILFIVICYGRKRHSKYRKKTEIPTVHCKFSAHI